MVRMRRTARYNEYARVYCTYVTLNGKIKRASFAVKIEPSLSNKAKQRLIAAICNFIKDKNIPEHVSGQIFHGFHELMRRTPWFRVRRIENYEAGMHYARG